MTIQLSLDELAMGVGFFAGFGACAVLWLTVTMLGRRP